MVREEQDGWTEYLHRHDEGSMRGGVFFFFFFLGGASRDSMQAVGGISNKRTGLLYCYRYYSLLLLSQRLRIGRKEEAESDWNMWRGSSENESYLLISLHL